MCFIAAAGLIVLTAGPAWARDGINLSWDDCGTHGTVARTFACDTNADSSIVVASFETSESFDNCLLGLIATVDIQVAAVSLPRWWEFKNPGSCRERSLRASAEFPFGPLRCHDPWQGCGASGVYAYNVGSGGPNRARILASVAMPCAWCLPVVAGVETYALKLIIRHDRTTGTGSCDGCLAEACIVLNTVEVFAVTPGPNRQLAISNPLARNYVTWQGGTADCPGATPTRNRTWGALKSIYR